MGGRRPDIIHTLCLCRRALEGGLGNSEDQEADPMFPSFPYVSGTYSKAGYQLRVRRLGEGKHNGYKKVYFQFIEYLNKNNLKGY